MKNRVIEIEKFKAMQRDQRTGRLEPKPTLRELIRRVMASPQRKPMATRVK